MSPAAIEILLSFGTALAAGLLIGAERERDEEQGGEERFAGVRTFSLIALSGAVANLLGTWVLVAGLLAMGGLVAVGYYRERNAGDIGMSTEVAALVTYGLGALSTARQLPLSMTDRLLLVAALATATLGLLAVKSSLHSFVARVSTRDFYATTKLLVLAVVMLPLLPDEALGPWGAVNPRQVGYLVLLIAAISFAGYVAMRIRGPQQGLAITGVLGGLASSTAVTLALSQRVREDPRLARICSAAVVLACATMFPRLLLEVYAVSPAVARASALPLVAATVLSGGAAALLFAQLPVARSRTSAEEIELDNPLRLSRVFWLAALFVVILIGSAAARVHLDETGVYLAASITGLADADAVALSLARLSEEQAIAVDVAARGALLAAAVNTASKIAIASVVGGRRIGLTVGASLAAGLAGGLVALTLGAS